MRKQLRLAYHAIDSQDASKVVEKATRETLPKILCGKTTIRACHAFHLPILMLPSVFASCPGVPKFLRQDLETDLRAAR